MLLKLEAWILFPEALAPLEFGEDIFGLREIANCREGSGEGLNTGELVRFSEVDGVAGYYEGKFSS